MADALKLFSPEWCAAAHKAVNENKAVYAGFSDPESFTMKMAFTCNDRGLITHLDWNEAKLEYFGPKIYSDSEIFLVINADVDTWREVAEGRTEGSVALMAGKIKFVKGPIGAAIENVKAFNNFLLTWGQVPTDWEA